MDLDRSRSGGNAGAKREVPEGALNPRTGVVHYLVRECSGKTVTEFLTARGFHQEEVTCFLDRGCLYVDGKRQRHDRALTAGQVLRVHTRPKSYHWPAGSLRERLAYDGPDFLVLDKPAGLPVHATLDNFKDNAKYILEQELGRDLYSTHRLDIPTRGLLILAKTGEVQARINRLFAAGLVEKHYHAITSRAVPAGEHLLYLDPEARVPRPHSLMPVPGWWECRLRIEASRPMDGNFCHSITLLTGKTHQIRAQLAALGAPILGDETYGGRVNGPYHAGCIALACQSLSFPWRGGRRTFTRPTPPLVETS